MVYFTQIGKVSLGVVLLLLFISVSPFPVPARVVEAQSCVSPPSGLIAWWPGDDDANDISGNGNHAQLQNGALAGVAGKVGGAFGFDGIDDIVSTPVILSSKGTIDLWVKPLSLGNEDGVDDVQGIIGTFGTGNGGNRLWVAGTGPDGGPAAGPYRLPINFGSSTVNDIDVPSPLVVEEWTHLAVTFDYDNDNYILYIDGQVADSSTAARSAPTGELTFGGLLSTFGQFFYVNGLIDEVEVFNRVLTQSEIQAIFDADSVGKCKFKLFLPVIVQLAK